MIEDRTDLDWIAERLPAIDDSDLDGPDCAREELLAHISATGSSLPMRSATRRRHASWRRRSLQLGLVAVGAAAVAAVAVNVGTTGHGTISAARAARIIAHAGATPAPDPNQVIAYTMTDADGTTTKIAQNDATPEDWSLVRSSGPSPVAEGQENGMREFYDPSSNTLYRDSDTSRAADLGAVRAPLLQPFNRAGGQLSAPQSTTLDGQPATMVTATYPDGSGYQIWINPDGSYRPLQLTITSASGATQTTRWSDYQTVTPSASTPSPAKLSVLYPSATVSTLDDAAYDVAARQAGAQ